MKKYEEYLCQEEIKMIDDFGRTYIADSNFIGADFLLEKWCEAKQDLFTLFGKDLIKEFPIVYMKTKEEENKELEKNIDHFFITKINLALDNIRKVYQENRSKDAVTIHFNGDWSWYSPVHGVYDVRDLFSIHQRRIDEKIIFKNYNLTLRFPKSDSKIPYYKELKQNFQKIIKLAKKDDRIKEAFDIPVIQEGYDIILEIEKIYNKISNQSKLKGTLCLSIHPMDYLTMSDNASNWTSCMSWIDHEGEYNTGTLEMLNSPCVVVAYLKSDNKDFVFDTCSEEYVWNNKKWRCLFIVDKEGMIVGVKDYPYHNQDLCNKSMDLLKEMMKDKWGIEKEEYTLENRENSSVYIWIDSYDFQLYFVTNIMYNDTHSMIACSASTNNFIKNRLNEFENQKYLYYNYSGKTYCYSCGNEIYEKDMQTSSGRCCECAGTRCCYNCGDFENIEDMVIDNNGNYYCQDCYEECYEDYQEEEE